MGDQTVNLFDVEVLTNGDFEKLTKEQLILVLRTKVQQLKKKDDKLNKIKEKLSRSEEKLTASQANNLKTSSTATFWRNIAIGLAILVPLLLLCIYNLNQHMENDRVSYIADCRSKLQQEKSNFKTQLEQERNNFKIKLDVELEKSTRTSHEQCDAKVRNAESSYTERVKLCIMEMESIKERAEYYSREWDKMRDNERNRGFFSNLFTFIGSIADRAANFLGFGNNRRLITG